MDIQENHIFLLVPNENLPSWYFQLCREFQQYEIKLIPIRLDQLKVLSFEKRRASILIFETNFKEKNWFGRIRHGFISMAVRSRLFSLYHISSFSDLQDFKHLSRVGHYFYRKLPLKLSLLALEIADNYYSKQNKENRWPGGTRVGHTLKELGKDV